MKLAITILFVLTTLSSFAQKKFITKTGTIAFEGSVDSFEPVKASNQSTTVVLDDGGNLAALALIKGFRFPVALMEEHFNENYMESDDFPKATLRGKLSNYDKFIKDGSMQTFIFIGNLEMHGVKKDLEFPIRLSYTSSGYELKTSFDIDTRDFNIDIPSVVRKKIADKIKVEVDAVLK